jgi:tryptophan-rich sensory protein
MNSVYVHVLAPVIAAALLSSLIFRRNLTITQYKNPWIPPGPFVGLVWLVLLGLLGYVHFKLYKKANNKFTTTCILIICYILYCLAYPTLTSLSSNPMLMTFLNQAALLVALLVTYRVFTDDSTLLLYMVPLLAWLTYVNIVTL